jgi:hypothetical protein
MSQENAWNRASSISLRVHAYCSLSNRSFSLAILSSVLSVATVDAFRCRRRESLLTVPPTVAPMSRPECDPDDVFAFAHRCVNRAGAQFVPRVTGDCSVGRTSGMRPTAFNGGGPWAERKPSASHQQHSDPDRSERR